MMEKEDIFEYIEGAPIKKVKQLAMTLTAMLNEKQLEVLNARFTKKVDFDPTRKRKEQPKPKKELPVEEEPKPNDSPDVAKQPEIPSVPDELPVQDKTESEEEKDALADLDFNFDTDIK